MPAVYYCIAERPPKGSRRIVEDIRSKIDVQVWIVHVKLTPFVHDTQFYKYRRLINHLEIVSHQTTLCFNYAPLIAGRVASNLARNSTAYFVSKQLLPQMPYLRRSLPMHQSRRVWYAQDACRDRICILRLQALGGDGINGVPMLRSHGHY